MHHPADLTLPDSATLAESVPALVFTAAPGGANTWTNRRYREYTGGDGLGFSYIDYIHPDDLPELEAAAKDSVKGGLGFDGRLRLRRADGQWRWFACRSDPVRDADGRVVRSLGVCFDIDDQVRAEEALRERDDRYRHAVELSPHVNWVTSAGGRMRMINGRWFEWTGTSGIDDWTDALHPDERDAVIGAFLDAVKGVGVFDVEHRARMADGQYRWMHARALPRRGADGRVLEWFGTTEDVHDRRMAEARLRALAELTQRLADEHDPDAIAEIAADVLARALDADRAGYGAVDARDETMTVTADRFAPGLSSLKGAYRLRDFGQHIDMLMAGEPVLIPDVLEDARTAPYAAALEAVGSRAVLNVPVMEAGRIAAMFFVLATAPRAWSPDELAFVREVAARTRAAAERRRAEAAERAAADRFRAVADAAPVMIWMNDADGRRVLVNRAYRDHFGLPDDAALGGFDYRAFLHPDDREAYLAANEACIARRERFSAEARSRRADGQWRLMRADMLPRFGEGERFEGYVGTLIDVTDARAAEAVLRDAAAAARDEAARAHEALRQAQKMEAMGQLTGGVAHDFNNLLTPIVGAFDLLLRREVGDARTRRLVEGGLQSAERARTLVQRLLAFARRQPLQPRALSLQALVAGMADLLGSTLGPRVALDLRLDPALPPVRADANQLEMAVLNLAVNARDAMPDGGRLEIAAGHSTHAPPVHLAPGRYARLCVADTGVGMDADTARRAVEPFFSTKGVGRGTGLGLSMVHGLAAQLGGAISIESQPGCGTSVHLWLPLAEGDEEGQAAAPGATAAERAAGTVLLVDDEPLVRASAAAMLADLGWRVVEVADAQAALAVLETDAPDLLMTDHLMPGMTGTELAREARRRRPGIRVLVSSGYAEVDGVAADLPRLVKPFRAAELRAALSAL